LGFSVLELFAEFFTSEIMEANNQALERRWQKLEAAKSHTRKIAYTLMGLTLTSLIVALTASAE
jgi:hypothetical protein